MILLTDEDIGTAVPTSLRSVGLATMSMAHRGWLGRPDTEWLYTAGRKRWLVFSSNKKMLLVPHERQAILDNKVGLVFLTNGEEYVDRILWLLLAKWKRLQELDATRPRPFALFLTPTGRVLERYRRFKL